MLSIFYIIILGLTLLFLYKTVIQSLIIYIKYKRLYGDKVIVKFFPLLGIQYYILNSFKTHNYSFQFLITTIQLNPEAKAILYLSGVYDVLILLDNGWIKTFMQETSTQLKFEDTFNTEMLFYDGLGHATGELWKKSRKFLNQIFHFKSISEMVEPMKDSMQHFVEDVKDLDNFQTIDLLKQVQHVASLSILNNFFGSKSALECNGVPFFQELIDVTGKVFIYSQQPFFMLKAFFFGSRKATHILNTKQEKEYKKRMQDLKSVAVEFIDKRQLELEKIDIDAFTPKTILDIYLKQYIINERTPDNMNEEFRSVITKELILKQFFTFFFAGTDTSSISTTMILYYLSIYPEIKEKVNQEILQNTPTSFDDIKFEHINQLNYINQVIKEVLRISPPVPFLFPRLNSKEVKVDDLVIEKGMIVTSRLINYNKFQDLSRFNPERFDESHKLDTFDYIPFSSGQRNCIGQHFAIIKIKLILCYILKNYEIRPVDNYQLKMRQIVLTVPDDPNMIQIKRKSN